jgi:uncharacterized membrane protein
VTSGQKQPAGPPGSARLPWQQPVTSGNLEYDRVLFFGDAIFAIAITLLVVDIRVPDVKNVDAARQLRQALPQMVGFGISFAVIGVFWAGHHGIFRHIVALDRRLIWLNLLFLGMIAFLPYPTSLLSRAGDQTAAVAFYAGWVALAALAESAIWLYACRMPGALTAETAPWVRRYYAYRILRVPVVFLLSIPVALARPTWAPYTWLAAALLGFTIRRMTRQARETDGSADRGQA